MIISKTSSNIKKTSAIAGTLFIVSIFTGGNQTEIVTLKNNMIAEENIIKQNGQSDIYKSDTNMNCIFFNLSTYDNSNYSVEKVDNIVGNDDKIYNLNKLDEIATLQDDWDNNGAKAFSEKLIDKAKNLIEYLAIQPEVFPTSCDTLQLEYDKMDGSHLEIEFGESQNAEMFLLSGDGKTKLETIPSDIETINKVVMDFYG